MLFGFILLDLMDIILSSIFSEKQTINVRICNAENLYNRHSVRSYLHYYAQTMPTANTNQTIIIIDTYPCIVVLAAKWSKIETIVCEPPLRHK